MIYLNKYKRIFLKNFINIYDSIKYSEYLNSIMKLYDDEYKNKYLDPVINGIWGLRP